MRDIIGLDDGGVIDFLGPQELLVGDGAASRLGELLSRWAGDGGRVFVVRDAGVAKLGLADDGLRSATDAGFTVTTFDEVVGEPDLDVAERVVGRAREQEPVAVVGVGGGSSMDLAKLAAALVTNPGPLVDYIGAGMITARPLPTVLVPTTAGTGAEATRVSMLSVQGEKKIVNSPYLVPVAAVLDPLLVTGLPRSITAATGLDALCHAIESFLSGSGTPMTRVVDADAMRLLAAYVTRAYDDGADLAARRATLYGAYLAGLGLNAGVIMGHSMAYTVANRVHLPHGITAAMALPYCLAYNLPGAGEEIAAIEEQVTGTGSVTASDVFDWLARLNARLGVPTSLRDAGVPEEACADMAAECVTRYPRPTNPVPMTEEAVQALYRDFWRGDLAGCVARTRADTPG